MDVDKSMKVLPFILILALIIPLTQAYQLSEVSIIPSGSLAPGTSVTASFQIDIDSLSRLSTFPEKNTLQLITELDNANWTWWIVLDGRGSRQPLTRGRLLQMTSWELTYHKDIARESVRVLLEGIAPQVTETQNKIIFDILELDPGFNVVPNSEIQRTSLVVNPTDITNGIASLTNDLQSLRTEIDNKTALGADISKAEEKYREAMQEIKSAQVFPPSGYTNAMIHLVEAKALIGVGLKYTDEAWALKLVNDATGALGEADKIITGLQANDSTRNNPKLTEIIDQRESAANLINIAKGEIANGNYNEARSIAIRAQEEGNKTFSNAVYLEKIKDEQSFIILCLGIIAIICLVIGNGIMIYHYWKKQKVKKEAPKQ